MTVATTPNKSLRVYGVWLLPDEPTPVKDASLDSQSLLILDRTPRCGYPAADGGQWGSCRAPDVG
jgi:hypothetical protein